MAARERTNARHQLGECKWLGEIVVRAAFEPTHPVLHGVARGEHENWSGESTLPHRTAERESGAAGKEDIQHDYIVRAKHCPFASVSERARRSGVDVLLP